MEVYFIVHKPVGGRTKGDKFEYKISQKAVKNQDLLNNKFAQKLAEKNMKTWFIKLHIS